MKFKKIIIMKVCESSQNYIFFLDKICLWAIYMLIYLIFKSQNLNVSFLNLLSN